MSYEEPLDPARARQVFRRILDEGVVSWDTGPNSHFLQEAAKDSLEVADCINVLRGGWLERPAEFNMQFQEYRYVVSTPRISVVVALVSEDELFLVTTWRKRK